MNETPHVVNQPRKTKQAIRHGRERENFGFKNLCLFLLMLKKIKDDENFAKFLELHRDHYLQIPLTEAI